MSSGITGFQDYWIAGSRVYFQRDPIATVIQPIVDLGTITPVSPAPSPTTVTLKDSDGGVKRTVAQAVTDIDETYEVKCNNLNIDNMSIVFLAAPVASFTQAATMVSAVPHWATPGRLLKLHDATGVFAYGLSAVNTVGSLTLGTDYAVVSLERGLIQMIPGGGFVTAANVNVSYTPRAISGESRLLLPQTGAGVTGQAFFVWSRNNNAEQSVREARITIAPTQTSFDDSNYSSATFKLTVLSDLTQATPAGRYLYWLGALPKQS